jgi:flagellar basal-body rod protein FlgG
MDGIAWASSAMVAARARLDVATGNLANVSTDGFRGAVARGVLSNDGVRIERGVLQTHGALRHTGRPFDLAIVGDGAFRVRSNDATVVETRAGAFTRDRDGYLRNDAGAFLLGTHGPVRVAQGAHIDASALGLPRESIVRSGFLESANIDAIGEMLHVMEAQRSFETAQKVVTAIDSTRQKSANDVARIK